MYSQGLDGAQRGEQALADSLQLVIVERQQVEVLQVLEGVDPQTVDFIGVQQPGNTRRKIYFSVTSKACCQDTRESKKTTPVGKIPSFPSVFRKVSWCFGIANGDGTCAVGGTEGEQCYRWMEAGRRMAKSEKWEVKILTRSDRIAE